jgi:hypothetical protein
MNAAPLMRGRIAQPRTDHPWVEFGVTASNNPDPSPLQDTSGRTRAVPGPAQNGAKQQCDARDVRGIDE